MIRTSKFPSPDTKPENQLGFSILSVFISGLIIGITLPNSNFKFSDRPLFIEAFIFMIFFIPSSVKCSLFKIEVNICFSRILSPYFCVFKGYWYK
jgi:hypothetical protein